MAAWRSSATAAAGSGVYNPEAPVTIQSQPARTTSPMFSLVTPPSISMGNASRRSRRMASSRQPAFAPDGVQPPDLIERIRDKPLSAEPRIDAHYEHVIRQPQHFVEGGDRSRRIDD